MPFTKLADSKTLPGSDGRAWAGIVSLDGGTATIDYSDALPGVSSSLKGDPIVIATGKQVPNEVGVSSSGQSQAVLDDGSGASSDDVHVIIVEQ